MRKEVNNYLLKLQAPGEVSWQPMNVGRSGLVAMCAYI